MRWTRIKKELENKLSPNLQGRLNYHITVYTKDYSASKSANRAWITFDKKEIVNISTEDFFKFNRYFYNKSTPTSCATSQSEITERSEGNIIEKGEFSAYDFTECSYHFLNMNIEEALTHKSPIINMFAVLDKRVGKRRLLKLTEKDLHPLVMNFLQLRIENEGFVTIH